jgi:hypothetical protein
MEFAKYISIALASMIKFFMGPITGFFTGIAIGPTILLSIIGMLVSVVMTTVFSKTISKFLDRKPNAKRQIFTKRARFAIKIYQKLGLFGIAMLTPPLFTPIGGTLIALSFKVNLLKMISYMAVSAVFWGYLVSWAVYKLTFISDWLRD